MSFYNLFMYIYLCFKLNSLHEYNDKLHPTQELDIFTVQE